MFGGAFPGLPGGGVGSPGRVLSAETKAKIGAANKGAKRRSRTPAEIEANRRLHVGKKRSLETKARIAASKKGALLGVPKSAEHRAKIAAALKGKTKSETHRAALSAAQLRYLARPK